MIDLPTIETTHNERVTLETKFEASIYILQLWKDITNKLLNSLVSLRD